MSFTSFHPPISIINYTFVPHNKAIAYYPGEVTHIFSSCLISEMLFAGQNVLGI